MHELLIKIHIEREFNDLNIIVSLIHIVSELYIKFKLREE